MFSQTAPSARMRIRRASTPSRSLPIPFGPDWTLLPAEKNVASIWVRPPRWNWKTLSGDSNQRPLFVNRLPNRPNILMPVASSGSSGANEMRSPPPAADPRDGTLSTELAPAPALRSADPPMAGDATPPTGAGAVGSCLRTAAGSRDSDATSGAFDGGGPSFWLTVSNDRVTVSNLRSSSWFRTRSCRFISSSFWSRSSTVVARGVGAAAAATESGAGSGRPGPGVCARAPDCQTNRRKTAIGPPFRGSSRSCRPSIRDVSVGGSDIPGPITEAHSQEISTLRIMPIRQILRFSALIGFGGGI